MSKEICLNMWVSKIPSKMYSGWVKRKLIASKSYHICAHENLSECDQFIHAISKDDTRKWVKSLDEVKSYKKEGWIFEYSVYRVSEDKMKIIDLEVRSWYKDVFKHVNDWFKKHGFIDLKKGSFNGGFCAVPIEDETTKNWGAPLAGENNKVTQIKEKFGDIVVYFSSLTKQESAKIKRFAKACEKKFDCNTCFVC